MLLTKKMQAVAMSLGMLSTQTGHAEEAVPVVNVVAHYDNAVGMSDAAGGGGGSGGGDASLGTSSRSRAFLAMFERMGLGAHTAVVAGGLAASSLVLTTMQTTTTAAVGVKSATPNPTTGRISITLTAAAPAGGIKVAWFVVG